MSAQDLWPLISEVHITSDSMELHISREALAQSLSLHPDALNPNVMRARQAFQRRRRGAETTLVTGTVAPQPDPVLQQNLARAHRRANRLRKGESLSSIARPENCSDSLIRSRVALAFRAPDLQRAILDGTAPPHLTTNQIVRTTLPHIWQEQAKALGLQFKQPKNCKPHRVFRPQRRTLDLAAIRVRCAVSETKSCTQPSELTRQFRT